MSGHMVEWGAALYKFFKSLAFYPEVELLKDVKICQGFGSLRSLCGLPFMELLTLRFLWVLLQSC